MPRTRIVTKPYTSLTLNEKIELIKTREKDKLSVKQLGEIFNCGTAQIYNTLKQKQEITEQWKRGNGLLKRKPKSPLLQINNLTWEWYIRTTAKNIPITGKMIKSKARTIAANMSCTEFKATKGWLAGFRNRHNINIGEHYLVNNEYEKDFDDWKEEIGELTEGYEHKDIYIGKETGLLFRAIPSTTALVKRLECGRGELSKERLTIFLCTNVEGEFEKPLVIGKAKKPKCFKNLKLKKLPIIWRANKKAWVTKTILDEWLYIFNNKMKKQNRKVILFLDNATCCSHLILTNVFLAWLPCQMLSHTNPIDQGINFEIKLNFRKMVLQSLLASIDNTQSIGELANNIDVLDAVLWLNKSINLIKSDTVKKCFIKAMFDLGLNQQDLTDDPLIDNNFKLLCSTTCEEVEIDCDEYVNIDMNLCTNKKFAPKDIKQYNSSEDENDNVPCASSIMPGSDIKVYKNALVEIKHLEMFALDQKNENELVESISNVKSLIEKEIASKIIKQKKLKEI